MRRWMERSARAEGKTLSLTFRICVAKEAAQKWRVDAAGGGKGPVNGTIQDCSIEVGRCLRPSPLLCPNRTLPKRSCCCATFPVPSPANVGIVC
jgi:hypothetical protein